MSAILYSGPKSVKFFSSIIALLQQENAPGDGLNFAAAAASYQYGTD
jgi:hypothetical protein